MYIANAGEDARLGSKNGIWMHFGIQALLVPKPISWNMFDANETPALDYCELNLWDRIYQMLKLSPSDVKSGSNIFTSLNGDVLALLMLKVAIPNGGTSSKAVLHSILALSCLHMGQHAKAAAYRARGVSLLSASLRAGSPVNAAFQNIATSMLLCMFEV
jgi:hypothetical protein